jgi:capsular polysaccharide biosynthesis protein
MELKQYMNIILKRLWIIILLPLVAAGTSAFISFHVMKPVYEANSTLYIIDKNRSSDSSDSEEDISYNEIWVGGQLVKDYTELIKSRRVTSSVIQELKLEGIAPAQLAGMIKVSSKNDTRIIEISVSDNDPKRAMEITNKVSDVFIEKVGELMGIENINIVDSAIQPTSPVKPRPMINIAIALFTGFFMAAGIIFLMEYLDDTIKTNEDVERYLNIPVLANIPRLDLK